MDKYQQNQNIERLYNQYVEKCKNGYYRKVGVTWRKSQGVFNGSVLESYNNKHKDDKKKS